MIIIFSYIFNTNKSDDLNLLYNITVEWMDSKVWTLAVTTL